MPFSCAGLLSKLRDQDGNAVPTEPKSLKRPCPFSSEINNTSDEIIPDVITVVENLMESLSPFSDVADCKTNVVESENKDCSVTNTLAESSENPLQDNTLEDKSIETLPVADEAESDIFDFQYIPLQITGSWTDFKSSKGDNYTRGCKWAPDGSCLVTCSNDNILRLFNLPPELWDTNQWPDISEMLSVVKIAEGELVYDFSWYPLMNSSEPSTCCLASCSKNSPVHLWDGFTGELRCSYRSYDQMDEVTAPRSLEFNADGQRLFCGFEKVIRIFNVNLPGRNCEERHTFAKKSGQPGIISCFAFTSANRNISAAGSFRKSIGIYSEPDGNLECILEGQKGGLTQLKFSPCGNLLYSGGRKDPEILCWDLRNLGSVLYCLRRSCVTNQRMQFDISRCGRYVISGNHNGVISIWDTLKEPIELGPEEFMVLEPIQFFLAHEDCVNGISLHPTMPLLCSSSGQRKFPDLLSDDEEDMFSSQTTKRDNSLRLWWIGKSS